MNSLLFPLRIGLATSSTVWFTVTSILYFFAASVTGMGTVQLYVESTFTALPAYFSELSIVFTAVTTKEIPVVGMEGQAVREDCAISELSEDSSSETICEGRAPPKLSLQETVVQFLS